jgi:hypothetical protein
MRTAASLTAWQQSVRLSLISLLTCGWSSPTAGVMFSEPAPCAVAPLLLLPACELPLLPLQLSLLMRPLLMLLLPSFWLLQGAADAKPWDQTKERGKLQHTAAASSRSSEQHRGRRCAHSRVHSPGVPEFALPQNLCCKACTVQAVSAPQLLISALLLPGRQGTLGPDGGPPTQQVTYPSVEKSML